LNSCCTIFGTGIAIARGPALKQVTGSEFSRIDSVQRGCEVVLLNNNGSRSDGLFAGFGEKTEEEFQQDFESFLLSLPDSARYNLHLEDSVIVDYRSLIPAYDGLVCKVNSFGYNSIVLEFTGYEESNPGNLTRLPDSFRWPYTADILIMEETDFGEIGPDFPDELNTINATPDEIKQLRLADGSLLTRNDLYQLLTHPDMPSRRVLQLTCVNGISEFEFSGIRKVQYKPDRLNGAWFIAGGLVVDAVIISQVGLGIRFPDVSPFGGM